jgi:hypothetical protein
MSEEVHPAREASSRGFSQVSDLLVNALEHCANTLEKHAWIEEEAFPFVHDMKSSLTSFVAFGSCVNAVLSIRHSAVRIEWANLGGGLGISSGLIKSAIDQAVGNLLFGLVHSSPIEKPTITSVLSDQLVATLLGKMDDTPRTSDASWKWCPPKNRTGTIPWPWVKRGQIEELRALAKIVRDTNNTPVGVATRDPVSDVLPELWADTDREAKLFMDGKQWCTAAYAKTRFGIQAPQLTKASTPKGLFEVVVERKLAQVESGKKGIRFVHHFGSLQLLKDAIDKSKSR